MPEIPILLRKGVKSSKNSLEKGVVLNSQNYDRYPLLMALTLPGHQTGVVGDIDGGGDLGVSYFIVDTSYCVSITFKLIK